LIEPYYHVRFRWWTRADLTRIYEDFKEKYTVEMMYYPKEGVELALYKDDREEIKITADTLSVLISNFRAVIYQKNPAKFTSRDAVLREEIGNIYTQGRPTPFPWSFTQEPKFEIEK
jgi:hypothetical protein